MLFLLNQVMNYFHVFMSLLIVPGYRLCNSLIPQTSTSLLQLVGSHYSSHISYVPQQLNSRQNGKFRGHHAESLLSSLVLSSIHSTVTVTNTLINHAGNYYIITNFYLKWDRSQVYPITWMILLVFTLDLSSALVLCNNNDIILVMGYN